MPIMPIQMVEWDGWDEVLYSSGPITRALTGGPRSTHRPRLVL